MGNFIKIAGVNPPSSRPRVDLPDALFPDAGALFLIDPTHPYSSWATGVPAHGSKVPNIAGSQASSLIGSTDVDGTALITSSVNVERTAKGGFHVDPSPTATGVRHGMVRMLGEAFSPYIYNNWQHSYYLSIWVTNTRSSVGTGTPPFTAAVAEGSSSYLLDIYTASNGYGTYPSSGGDHSESFLGRSPDLSQPVGEPRRYSLGASSWMRNAGTGANTFIPAPPNGSTIVKLQAFQMGKAGSTGPVDTQFASPGAGILYRSYFEDLTVSGRTYAEVEALDNQLFTREMLTPGGRYYGDTWTDPATVV